MRILLGIGLVLLSLELSARLYLFGLAGLSPARVDSVRALPNTGYTRPSKDPALVFEMKPDVDGWFKLARFRTNSQGLRDREYALRKPQGTFRVAVLGASFALPAGVEIEEAFHSLLEERLSEERGPTAVEFINFAVGAYGARQILRMLEARALAYDPDLVLVSVTKLSLEGMLETQPQPLGACRRRDRRARSSQNTIDVIRSSHGLLLRLDARLLPVRGRESSSRRVGTGWSPTVSATGSSRPSISRPTASAVAGAAPQRTTAAGPDLPGHRPDCRD